MMVQGRTHRMTEMIARLAPERDASSRRAPRSRAVYARMQARSQGRVRSELALSRRRHPVQGSARRKSARLTLWLLMARRRVRDDHLGRERREPHAHARRAPRAGARRSRGARRRRGAAAPAAARREPPAHAHRRRARPRHRDRRRASCSRRSPQRYSPRANEIRLDGVVLGFTLALSVAVALLLSFVASLPKEGHVRARGSRRARAA